MTGSLAPRAIGRPSRRGTDTALARHARPARRGGGRGLMRARRVAICGARHIDRRRDGDATAMNGATVMDGATAMDGAIAAPHAIHFPVIPGRAADASFSPSPGARSAWRGGVGGGLLTLSSSCVHPPRLAPSALQPPPPAASGGRVIRPKLRRPVFFALKGAGHRPSLFSFPANGGWSAGRRQGFARPLTELARLRSARLRRNPITRTCRCEARAPSDGGGSASRRLPADVGLARYRP